MAVANPRKKRTPGKPSLGRRLWAALKSQWLATVLILPLGFLGLQTYIARQDAREARAQSVNVDRISHVQESGKALDLALAAYFQSVSELGLAERHLQMPGTYSAKPVPQAQADVLTARTEARRALAEHGADVQALRGTFDEVASTRYMAELANISATVERDADIAHTGSNITSLSKLVVARNALVDQAMQKVT
jgi:hypothetical protein